MKLIQFGGRLINTDAIAWLRLTETTAIVGLITKETIEATAGEIPLIRAHVEEVQR